VGDLSAIHLLVNTTSADQVSACSIFYNPLRNQLFIYDDSGTTLSAPIVPGSTGTLSNSQCSVSGTGSSVTKASTKLTLNVAVTFLGNFSAGKRMYASAAGSDGLKTGWVLLGGGGGAPLTFSLTPHAGSGLSQTFALSASSPSGAVNLSSIHLLFNTTSANQASACSIFYNPVRNQLFIYSDSGTTLSAPIVPGRLGHCQTASAR
jgi:hypothetical protein